MTPRAFIAGMAALISAGAAVLWSFAPPMPGRAAFYMLHVYLAARYTCRMLES